MRRANRGAFKRFGQRLRWRLVWSFLAFGIGASSTWFYREDIFLFLIAPAEGSLSPFGGAPVFTGPTAMMGATISLALRGGALAAVPTTVVGVYTLIRPVLPDAHHRLILQFFAATLACFLTGGAFAYFVMLPASLGFLLNFGDDVAIPLITINEYLDLMMAMMFWLGVVFEIPVVMYLLAKAGIVSYKRMTNLRKFVPVSAFILSAIITPTFDAFNQTLVAVPIILLYELGLFVAWFAHPDRGNYLWLASIGRGIRWVWHIVVRVAKVVRAVALSPYTVPRWIVLRVARAIGKVVRKVRGK
jgi:sec-independent protein translocase protein TatC